MSSNSIKCLLVMAVTALYVIYFIINCIIIPYPAAYDKNIIQNDRENDFISNIYTDAAQQKPAGERAEASTGGDVQDTGCADGPGQSACPARQVPEAAPPRLNDETALPDTLYTSQPLQDNTEEGAEFLPDSAGQDTRPALVGEGGIGASARQNGSRVLLSGSSTVKALSSLSFRDKLWLASILSRCSMEEIFRIMAMLEDGVTYQENLEMYRILRKKVTDEEQTRLDTLIESYTQ